MADFNKWWRRHVSYRGMNGESGSRGAALGEGLYSAALSNKSMAKEYGEVFFAVNARPIKPVKFNTLNRWEIWIQGRQQIEKYKGVSIRQIVIAEGYDGVEITGREYCCYNPENVRYFKTKEHVKHYYYETIEF